MVIPLTGMLALATTEGILAATGTDPLLPAWGQLGVLGLLVLAFFTDQIVTGRKYAQVVKERDEERKRTEAAEKKLEEKFLPALIDGYSALKTVNEILLPALDAISKQLHRLDLQEQMREERRLALPPPSERGT